jgi:hypothetical protein
MYNYTAVHDNNTSVHVKLHVITCTITRSHRNKITQPDTQNQKANNGGDFSRGTTHLSSVIIVIVIVIIIIIIIIITF